MSDSYGKVDGKKIYHSKTSDTFDANQEKNKNLFAKMKDKAISKIIPNFIRKNTSDDPKYRRSSRDAAGRLFNKINNDPKISEKEKALALNEMLAKGVGVFKQPPDVNLEP